MQQLLVCTLSSICGSFAVGIACVIPGFGVHCSRRCTYERICCCTTLRLPAMTADHMWGGGITCWPPPGSSFTAGTCAHSGSSTGSSSGSSSTLYMLHATQPMCCIASAGQQHHVLLGQQLQEGHQAQGQPVAAGATAAARGAPLSGGRTACTRTPTPPSCPALPKCCSRPAELLEELAEVHQLLVCAMSSTCGWSRKRTITSCQGFKHFASGGTNE